MNIDVASLHEIPVAETVYNARRQQGTPKTSQRRRILTGGVSAATWSEGVCGNWRDPRYPAKKARRGALAYNREWEVAKGGTRESDRVIVLLIHVPNAWGGKGPDR